MNGHSGPPILSLQWSICEFNGLKSSKKHTGTLISAHCVHHAVTWFQQSQKTHQQNPTTFLVSTKIVARDTLTVLLCRFIRSERLTGKNSILFASRKVEFSLDLESLTLRLLCKVFNSKLILNVKVLESKFAYPFSAIEASAPTGCHAPYCRQRPIGKNQCIGKKLSRGIGVRWPDFNKSFSTIRLE